MKANRAFLVLFLLAGLAVGIAGGWILGGPPERTPQAALPLPEPENLHARQQQTEFANEPATKAAPLPDVAALMADVAAVRETGEIRGSVLLDNGSPLPGVRIRATPHLPPNREAATPEEELAVHAAQLALRRVRERTVQTDANGEYRLSGLDAEFYYSVTANLHGYEVKPAGRIGAAIEYHAVGHEVYFVAHTAMTVRLDVRLPDGRQPGRVQIGCSGAESRSGGTSYWYWTPAQPTRAFEPGEWTLTFRAGESSEYTCEPVNILLEQGVRFEPLTVRLHTSPGIVGTVTMPPGISRPRVTIELLREVNDEYGRVDIDRRAPYGGNPQSLNAWRGEARFEFLDLEPGSYRLILAMFDKPVETRDVVVTSTVEREDFTVPEPDIKDFVVVRVAGPDGPVTENVRFNLTERTSGTRSGATAHVLVRGDGEYWLPRPERKREGSEFSLSVRAGALGGKTQELDPETSGVIEVYFGAPAFITVEVLGFEQHPQREHLIQHVWKAGKEPPSRVFMDNLRMGREPVDQGKRRHGPLEPGDYEVGLLVRGNHVMESFQLARRAVSLLAGENHATLTAPELYGFVIEIPEQYRSKQIDVRHMADRAYRFNQDYNSVGESEYAVERLKAGEYEISMSDVGAMTVSVPESDGRRIEFQPRLYNAFLLVDNRVSEPKDIGLREGDIVIEIDGVAITDMAQGRRMLNDAAKLESTTWTVLRGGARLQVTFNPADAAASGLGPQPTRVD